MNSCSGSRSAAVVPNCYQSTFFLVVSPQRRRRRRSKPSLITVNCMNPHPTNFNLLRQNIVFSYSERIPVSFSWLFHSFSFFFCYTTFLLFFTKIMLLLLFIYYLLFFVKIIFIFSCSGMFRNVPECSGMFRHVPECSVFRVLSTAESSSLILFHPCPHLYLLCRLNVPSSVLSGYIL